MSSGRPRWRRWRRLGPHLRALREIAWVEYRANPVGSTYRAGQVVRDRYGSILSAVLLEVALMFIRAIIEHWWDNRNKNPQQTYTAGEPGYDDAQ